MEYDVEKWFKALNARDNFREEHHKLKWFEGVGLTKVDGRWTLLVFQHPARKPPSLEDTFQDHPVLVRTQEVKSHSKNQKKTEKIKQGKAARSRQKKSQGGKQASPAKG